MTEQCTIATRSTIADAPRLAGDVHVVTLDADAADAAAALGIERDLLLRLAMLFELDDLVAALVPALLRARLDAGSDVVVYLDPSVHVRGSLNDFTRAASKRGAALARGRDVEHPDTGPFGTSVVAVGLRARDVLDEWVGALSSLDPGEHSDVASRRARAWIDRLVAADVVEALDDPTDAAPEAAGAGGADRGLDAFCALADGTPIDVTMRAVYRAALFDDAAAATPPPNPFAPGEADAFVAWLREPVLPDVAPTVGRYLARVWSDSERLQDEFSELEPETAEAFEVWCRDHGGFPSLVFPTDMEVRERTARRRARRPTGPRPAGVNVVGYHRAALGLGEVARNVVDALHASGVSIAAVGNPATASRALYDVEVVAPDAAPYDVNLFVVTADMLAPLAGRLGPGFLAGRRNIGFWFWEAERYRAEGPTPASIVLDEVWAPSAFVRGAVDAAHLGCAVEHAPVPVSVPATHPEIDRDALGLPADRFVFLFMFDYFSVVARKNPAAVVDVYMRAFDPSDGATLVLKSINGSERPHEAAALRAVAGGRTDVVFVDDYLSPEEHAGMLAACDVYVSLHRAEGLGLTMAEAMALGKPVIATGYSGNLEFMNDDVAFLVDSTLVPIGPGVDPYPADARWAEPDTAHAALLMRKVFDDRAHAADVGRRASDLIRSRWSLDSVGRTLAGLVEQARARPRDPSGSWRQFFMRGWRNKLFSPIPRQYRFDWLADGFPLDRSAHTVFSFALQRSLALGGRRMPPDPNGDDATTSMVDWLNAPIAPRRRAVVSRYFVQYWHDHAELQERFPGIESDRVRALAYRDWIAGHWHDETDVDFRLVPDR